MDYDAFNKSFRTWLTSTRVGVKKAISDTAVDIAERAADLTATIFNDETDGTGRSAASIGKYNPDRLKGASADSGPQDAFWSEKWVKDEYRVEYGSHVPYVPYIDLGFSVETQRTIFIEGRFVTIKPFSFQGIHAFDRAITQVEGSRSFMQAIFLKNFKKVGFS